MIGWRFRAMKELRPRITTREEESVRVARRARAAPGQRVPALVAGDNPGQSFAGGGHQRVGLPLGRSRPDVPDIGPGAPKQIRRRAGARVADKYSGRTLAPMMHARSLED